MLIDETTLDGMPEPLNYEGPLPDDVIKLVSKFLETPIESDGGWPEIPDEEWKMLHEVFYQIIEAKFQRDCDSDQGVEFELCNRKKHRMQSLRIPYTTKTDTDMEQAAHAIGHAANIVDQLSRQMSFAMSDRRRADARKKKMCAVIGFLASNGHIRAHNRVVEYVSGQDGRGLFIGKDDDVWAPLGLTASELHTVYRENTGRTTEALDEVLINAANCMMDN